MRYIFSFILLLVIFENALSDQFNKYRMALAMKTMKNIHEAKMRRRRLQEATDIDSESESDVAPTNGTEINPEVPATNITANESTPIEAVQNNTNASIQIRKFHKFKKVEKKITYNVFFYFLGKKIARTIVIRIKIIYKHLRLLRALQEIEGESIPSNCTIKDKYNDYIGQDGNGTNIEYDCAGETQLNNEISNATIDEDYSVSLDGETISLKEINFDTDAANEVTNLADNANKEYELIGTISKSNVLFKGSNFFINGEPRTDPELETKIGQPLDMEFIHYTNKDNYIKKNITCDIYNSTALNCHGTVRSYLSNISAAKCHDEKVYLSINMDPDANDTFFESQQIRNYRKSSSGLSGGAIAGIVIACVVVILAASIAAILLRKPKPPIDNTTVVGLNTTDNI